MITFEQLAPTLTGVTASAIWAWIAQRGRHGFERRQDGERRVAQEALEALRTQLSFEAEMRRQMAAAKLKAIGSISEKSDELLRLFGQYSDAVHGHGPACDIDDFWHRNRELGGLLRANAYLFSDATLADLKGYAKEIGECANRALRTSSVDSLDLEYEKMEQTIDALCSVARSMLPTEDSTGRAAKRAAPLSACAEDGRANAE